MAGVLAAVFAAPSPASAAGSTLNAIAYRQADGSFLAVLGWDWPVGDCNQFEGSSLRLDKPDAAGNARYTWLANGNTTYTKSSDVWHQQAIWRDGVGRTIVTSSVFDGPNMKPSNTYSWGRSEFLKVSPAAFNRISEVKIVVSC